MSVQNVNPVDFDFHTNSPLRSQIRTRHHLDAQIILHFADDFEGVVELPVGVLFRS